jgi:uncharacterized membrane protein
LALPGAAPVSDPVVIDPQTGHEFGPMSAFVSAEWWSGPVPSPSAIERYERVLPGLGDRLIRLTEGEAAHRQLMEKTTVDAAVRNQSRGQIFGFIIAIVVIVGGIVLVALGMNAEGLAAILTPLALLVGAFVYREIRNAPREPTSPTAETSPDIAERQRT